MKKSLFTAIMGLTLFGIPIFMPQEASAIPGFARQTGKACTFCHFQHYPSLNEEGRKFKAGGYTDIEGQGLVTRDGLSLPVVLNASLIASVGYVKTNGNDDPTTAGEDESKVGTNKGAFQFPSEAALMVGGRAGEHFGFLLDLSRADEDAADINEPAAGSIILANYKMPIVYDVGGSKLSVIPFTTAEQGVAYGFELLNTGAVMMQRPFEDSTAISAQQYITNGDMDSGKASGIAFVAANDIGFLNISLWAPTTGMVDTGFDLSQYIRAAATPHIGDWDLGIGAQYWTGEAKVGDTTNNPDQVYVTKAWAIDAQAQGEVGSMPLGIYITYGIADAKDKNLFNDEENDKKAFTALAELGVVPKKVTVGLGYRAGDNGEAANSSDNATLLGVTYLLAQNLQLQLNQTFLSGSAYSPKPTDGNQLTTLMVSGAF